MRYISCSYNTQTLYSLTTLRYQLSGLLQVINDALTTVFIKHNPGRNPLVLFNTSSSSRVAIFTSVAIEAVVSVFIKKKKSVVNIRTV